MNKTSLMAISATGIMLVGLSAPKAAQAFWLFDMFDKEESVSTPSALPRFMQALIDRLAEKFNLDKNQVQQVITEVKTEKQQERRTEMQSKWEAKLTEAVADGKITEAQKQLIITKHTEVQAKLLDWQNLTFEERKTKLEELRNELKTWAEENTIPNPFQLMAGLGYGRDGGKGFDFDNDDDRGRGRGMGMMGRDRDDDSDGDGRRGMWR